MSDKKLILTLLGRPTVELDGSPVDGFNSDKTRALLFYLATVPEVHSRPALAGLFWGDLPEERAAANLRKSVASLRKILPSYLTITRQQIAFCSEMPHQIDINTLRGIVSQTAVTRALLAQSGEQGLGQIEDKDTFLDHIAQLEEAVALYQGDYLAEFFVRDALAFEEWMLAERRHLQEEVLAILHLLAHTFASQGELTKSIHHGKRLLEIEPWREEIHRLLMTLYVRSGQPGAAIGQFRHCRELLQQELELDVMPETEALYREIREQAMSQPHIHIDLPEPVDMPDPDVSSSSELPLNALLSDTAPVAQQAVLPSMSTSFVGRETEINSIKERLADERCRLLTLLGAGGVGKTTMSIALAHELVTHHKHRVYFVDLSHIDDPDYLPTTIVEQMAHPFSSDQEPQAQLQQYFQQLDCLLILDNFEHLLAGATMLSQLVSSAPRLKLLVTSRQRLNLHEEWIFEVGGLDYPGTGPVYPDSMQLFLARATQIRADFSPEPEELTAIGQICQHLEGLPLALELAATWVRLLSPHEILSELKSGSELLTNPPINRPQRHQSLRTVFEQSWRQLTQKERTTLRKLSVFRGEFTLDAAKAVTTGSVVEFVGLVDKSLLSRAEDGRFRISENLRRFTAEELSQDSLEEVSARQAHSTYFLQLLSHLHSELVGPDPIPATQAIEAQLDNIRAGWMYAAKEGSLDLLNDAAPGLIEFLLDRNRYFEAIHLFDETVKLVATHFIACLDAPAPNAHSSDKQDLLDYLSVELGYFYLLSGQLDQAEEMLQRGLDSLRLGRAPEFKALVYHRNMAFYFKIGDLDKAESAGKICLALYEELQKEREVALVLNQLGVFSAFRGEYDQAVMHLEEAAMRVRSASVLSSLPVVYLNLANVHGIMGNDAAAEHLYEESERLLARFDKPIQMAILFDSSGQHDAERGRFHSALAKLRSGYAIYRQIGIAHHLINNLNSQARTHIDAGSLTEAHTCLRESIELSTSHDLSPWLPFEQALLVAKLLTLFKKHELAATLVVAADKVKPDYAHMEAWASQLRTSIMAEINEELFARAVTQYADKNLSYLLVKGWDALDTFYSDLN